MMRCKNKKCCFHLITCSLLIIFYMSHYREAGWIRPQANPSLSKLAYFPAFLPIKRFMRLFGFCFLLIERSQNGSFSARIYLNFPTCKHFSKLTFLFISARVYFGGGNGRTCFDSRLLCLLADQPGFPNCSLCNALVQWTSSALTSFCCHYVM